jgi:hypothetical protein
LILVSFPINVSDLQFFIFEAFQNKIVRDYILISGTDWVLGLENESFCDLCCYGLFWLLILESFDFVMNLNRMGFCFLLILWLCDGRLGWIFGGSWLFAWCFAM